MGESLASFGEDFGQRIDLCGRIREILRNYPEGTSILKELVQNADDALAKEFVVTLDEREHSTVSVVDGRLSQFQGASLLVYNDSTFTERDFESLQRLGESLKRGEAGKTGKFGIGFNSVYHVTELPSFASGSKVVFLDPQARFVPSVDPSNPGKMVDIVKDPRIVSRYPDQFAGFAGAFGWAPGRPYEGTLFRLPLRTTQQAETSRLSRRTHGVEQVRRLLDDFAKQAGELMLFLKSIETIRVCRWTRDYGMVEVAVAALSTAHGEESLAAIRELRRMPLVPEASVIERDFVACINGETWVVCNQLGGGRATSLAIANRDTLGVVPWAGVAARIGEYVEGRAYCGLPLPVKTGLGVHVNGFFEVSSNRRDVWLGDDDMSGDGATRAEWNLAIAADVAAPCLVRCLAACAKRLGPGARYDALWPDRNIFLAATPTVWRVLAESATHLAAASSAQLLWSPHSATFVTPCEALCLPEPEGDVAEAELQAVARVLSAVGEPVVGTDVDPALRAVLAERVARRVASAGETLALLRRTGSSGAKRIFTACSRADALTVLRYVVRPLAPHAQWRDLDGLPLIPLSSSSALGVFRYAPALPAGNAIQAMGFSQIRARAAAAHTKGNLEAALALLVDQTDNIPCAQDVRFYFVAADEALTDLFRHADTVRRDDFANDPILSKLLDTSDAINIVQLSPDIALPDLVESALPAKWLSGDIKRMASDNSSIDAPTAQWFARFWNFATSGKDARRTLTALADNLPLVPLASGEVVPLSRRSAVLHVSVSSLHNAEAALRRLGVCFGHSSLPPCLGGYIFPSTIVGVLEAIEAGRLSDGVRFEADRDADALRVALADLCVDSSLLPQRLVTLAASLPIWQVVGGRLSGKPSYAPTWTAAIVELDAMAAETGATYLVAEATLAERRLARMLGTNDLDRAAFVSSRIEHAAIEFVALILRDLPMLRAVEPTLVPVVAEKCFVPTNDKEVGARARPRDLFDPTAQAGAVAVTSLLPPGCFPSDELASPENLAGLHSLGLKAALDWPAVELAVRRVDADADRGRALLVALDDLIARRRLSLTNDGDDSCDEESPHDRPRKAEGVSSWLGRFSTFIASADAQKEAGKRAALRLHRKRERDAALSALATLEWLPIVRRVSAVSAHYDDILPLLPSETLMRKAAARPSECRPAKDAWCCSGSLFILDADEPRSSTLIEALGWHKPISTSIIAYQLGLLGRRSQGYDTGVRRSVTNLVLKLYDALDHAAREDGNAPNDICRGLSDAMTTDGPPPCVWVGTTFVPAARVALHGSPVDCAPYLHALPVDLAGYERLFKLIGVRDAFGPSDYASLLRLLRDEQQRNGRLDKRVVAVALAASRALVADEALTKERCADLDIVLPDEQGMLSAARSLVYDDAPWLRDGDVRGGLSRLAASMQIVHPDLPIKGSAKLGATSLRRALLDRGNKISIHSAGHKYKTDDLPNRQLFGENVDAVAFGQHEPITSRLRHILEVYPEGAGILCEMVQNADDARASTVKVVLDVRARGSRSLLSPRLSEYQGPCIWVYNNAEFSDNDWHNLVRVGQGSKLEKPHTTGRFGLGFNSVYHLTDVPQVCSGEYVLFLDPHAAFVPGATPAQPGLRVRFVGADLRAAFPDQFEPWSHFCELDQRPFSGTIFRLPLRSDASKSEISKRVYSEADGLAVLDHFRSVADEVLIFLRNVRDIDVGVLDDKSPDVRRLFRALAAEQPLELGWPDVGDEDSRRKAGLADAVAEFLAEDSTASLYAKLAATPETRLPTSASALRIVFEESDVSGEPRVDDFVLAAVIGAGKARDMACDAAHRELKFVPLGGCAIPVGRTGVRGRAFCFLPLPARTAFPVHVNGYFELSSNRMDVWHGEDAASAAGRRRSEWNRALLEDAVALAYALALLNVHRLGQSNEAQYKSLSSCWPIAKPTPPWDACRDAVFLHARRLRCLTTPLNGGTSVEPMLAVAAPVRASTDVEVVADLLLKQCVPVVRFEDDELRSAMIETGCVGRIISPALVRAVYASIDAAPRPASLVEPTSVASLLQFALKDLVGKQNDDRSLCLLAKLPMLLLESGELVTFEPAADSSYILAADDQLSRALLRPLEPGCVAHEAIADLAFRVAGLLSPAQTRVRPCSPADVAAAISKQLPSQWFGIDLVSRPTDAASDAFAPPEEWCKVFWRWLVRAWSPKLDSIVASFPLLPAIAGLDMRRVYVRADPSCKPPLISSSSSLPSNVIDAILAAGVAFLDTDIVSAESLEATSFAARASEPTPAGVANALLSARGGDGAIIWEGLERHESSAHCATLRNWLSAHFDVDDRDAKIAARKLPIFSTVGASRHAAIDDGVSLPPASANPALLSLAAETKLLLEIPDAASRRLLNVLDVARVDLPELVVAALPRFESVASATTQIHRDAAEELLRELPSIVATGSHVVIENLACTPFVPTGPTGSHFACPCELYDPQLQALQDLLEDDCFPATTDAAVLDALRKLGLRVALDRTGALASACSTQDLAAKADTDPALEPEARRRGAALLKALDRLLEEVDDHQTSAGNDEKDNEFGAKLRSLRWIPVLRDHPNDDKFLDELLPQATKHHDSSRCAVRKPVECRPVADAWLCSARLSLVARQNVPRSDALLELLHWRGDVDPVIVAHQLDALDRTFNALLDNYCCDDNNGGVNVENEDCSTDGERDYEDDESRLYLPDSADMGLSNFCRNMTTVVPTMYSVLDRALESSSTSFEPAADVLEKTAWIWLGAGFAPSTRVAFQAEDYRCGVSGSTMRSRALQSRDRPLHECPELVASSFRKLAGVLGVKSHFEVADYAAALARLGERCPVLDDDRDLSLAVDLITAVTNELCAAPRSDIAPGPSVLVPDAARRLVPISALVYDDAPWLSASVKAQWMRAQSSVSDARETFCHDSIPELAARALGIRSLRSLLLSNEQATQSIPCPSVDTVTTSDDDRVAIVDLLAVADTIGAQNVTLIVDEREHPVSSLLSPALAAIQGPALIIYFEHAVPLQTDDIVRALLVNDGDASSQLSPGKSAANGPQAAPQLRKPLVGRGLSAAFKYTDCLIALAGDVLHIFNPTGEFIAGAEDADKPRGRRYAIADGELARKFSDQFAPFESLPFGVSAERGCPSGTVFRLPFRIGGSFFERSGVLDRRTVDGLIQTAEEYAYRGLVFAETLSCVGAHRFVADTMLPLFSCSRRDARLVSCIGLETPPNNDVRAPRRQMNKLARAWRMSKMQQFFASTIFGSSSEKSVLQSSWIPPRILIEFEISRARFFAPDSVGDDVKTPVTSNDSWLACSVLAPNKRVRELSDDLALVGTVGQMYADAPVVSVAAEISKDAEGVPQDLQLSGGMYSGGAFAGVDVSSVTPYLHVDAPFAIDPCAAATLLDDDNAKLKRRLVSRPRRDAEMPPKFDTRVEDLSAERYTERVLGEWNEALWAAALIEVMPHVLLHMRDRLGSRPEQLYRWYWPTLATGRDGDRKSILACHSPAVAQGTARRLCREALFLSARTCEFSSAGMLRAAPFPIGVENLLRRHMPLLLQVPARVAVDLAVSSSRLNWDQPTQRSREWCTEALAGSMSLRSEHLTLVTSATLRHMLGRKSAATLAAEISRDDSPTWLAIRLLQLCSADGLDTNDTADGRRRRQQCWAEIASLPLLPLERSGAITTFVEGRGVLATQRQLSLCAGSPLAHRVMSPVAAQALPKLFGDSPRAAEFTSAVGVERFGAAALAAELRTTLLPESWTAGEARLENWSDAQLPSGSALWLRDFWAEVSLCDPEATALFANLPLVPLRGGGLANCSCRSFLIASVAVPVDVVVDAKLSVLEAEQRDRFAELRHSGALVKRAHNELNRERYNQIGEFIDECWQEIAEPDPEYTGDDNIHKPSASPLEARLIGLIERLRLPVLELAWWPETERSRIVRALLGDGGLVPRALRCLGEQAERLDWEAASDEEREWLLGVLAGDVRGPAAREWLFRLPLFQTLGGGKMDLVARADRPHLSALGPGVDRELRRVAPPGWARSDVVLEPRSVLEADLLSEAGVPRLELASAIARLVVPQLATYDDELRLKSLLSLLVERWDNELSRSIELRNALAISCFVPCGGGCGIHDTRDTTSNNNVVVIGKTTLARPDSLLDPSVEELADACGLDDNESLFFPAAECRTPQWLRMLRDLGLRRALDPATFLAAAELAAEKRELNRSRHLLGHLRRDFERQQPSQRGLSSDPALLDALGSVRFVPVVCYDGGSALVHGFSSFKESAVHVDRALCWTSTPLVTSSDAPPRLLWSALGLRSPPDETSVLAHLNALSSKLDTALAAVDPARLECKELAVSVIEAYTAIYSFLIEAWPRLSPRVKHALPSTACVPVAEDESGPWYAVAPRSRRVFLELPDEARRLRLAPLVFALPPALERYGVFLKSKLEVAVSPTASEYVELLRRLNNSGGRRLDPNELAAALRLVELLAASDGSSRIAAVLPDETGNLVDADRLVVDDDPELRRRLPLLRAAHPRLSPRSCETLGVKRLSAVATEHLVAQPRDIGLSPEAADLAELLASPNFGCLLAELVSYHRSYYAPDDDEDVADIAANLASLRVVQVDNLETTLGVPDRYVTHAPQIALSTSVAAFAIGATLFVAEPENGLGIAAALCAHLRLPKHVLARPTADLLRTSNNQRLAYPSRRLALSRGKPGATLDDADAKCLSLAPLRRFAPGEVVAIERDGHYVYATVETDNNISRAEVNFLTVPTLNLRIGAAKVARFPATRVYAFDKSRTESTHNEETRPHMSFPLSEPAHEPEVVQAPLVVEDRADLMAVLEDLLRRAQLPPLDADKKSLLHELATARAQAATARAEADEAAAQAVEARAQVRDACAGSEFPLEFLCPITRELMTDPVIAADGFSYERAAISRWFRSHATSPQTNAHLRSRVLVENRSLKALIEARCHSVSDVKEHRPISSAMRAPPRRSSCHHQCEGDDELDDVAAL